MARMELVLISARSPSWSSNGIAINCAACPARTEQMAVTARAPSLRKSRQRYGTAIAKRLVGTGKAESGRVRERLKGEQRHFNLVLMPKSAAYLRHADRAACA